ncbi:hypothetical protein AC579_3860 [Pseudocercospora musae]|uniref:Uncharacterized protein n=1 Tax=Pseudocercospora musae TaxID=113226 RepID=A0A139IRL7_9PEZI|nr:hypothetical protein AC579_3860 [Pseudocercospora musae]
MSTSVSSSFRRMSRTSDSSFSCLPSRSAIVKSSGGGNELVKRQSFKRRCKRRRHQAPRPASRAEFQRDDRYAAHANSLTTRQRSHSPTGSDQCFGRDQRVEGQQTATGTGRCRRLKMSLRRRTERRNRMGASRTSVTDEWLVQCARTRCALHVYDAIARDNERAGKTVVVVAQTVQTLQREESQKQRIGKWLWR